jgi:predicted RecA/RadA family phage recombinase
MTATATFIHAGEYIDHTPAADVPLGAVVVLADAIAIAHRPIPAGTLGSLAMGGIFEVPRAAGALIPQGKRLFWDPAAQNAGVDAAALGVVPMGIAACQAADTATTVRVRLNH